MEQLYCPVRDITVLIPPPVNMVRLNGTAHKICSLFLALDALYIAEGKAWMTLTENYSIHT